MSSILQAEEYPYVDCNPEIANGKPIIAGTRITVRCIVGYYQMGMISDEILRTLAHLTPSQLHSALAYYFNNQDEVDSDLAESSDTEFWESQVLPRANLKNLNYEN